MNTWNTLPESYEQRVYNNTLATVKRQIQLEENQTPTMVFSIVAAGVEVALAMPEIGSADQIIPIYHNCTADKLHFGMGWGRADYQAEFNNSDERDYILIAS
jgi:hypothetical protein